MMHFAPGTPSRPVIGWRHCHRSIRVDSVRPDSVSGNHRIHHSRIIIGAPALRVGLPQAGAPLAAARLLQCHIRNLRVESTRPGRPGLPHWPGSSAVPHVAPEPDSEVPPGPVVQVAAGQAAGRHAPPSQAHCNPGRDPRNPPPSPYSESSRCPLRASSP